MGNTEQLDIAKTVKAMHKAKDYHGILALVKDMNTDRIRDRRTLEIIANAYNKSGLYKEAREHLLIAYERFPASRSLAYKLVVISIKLNNLDDAVDFYEDFCRLAPGDNNRFVLKYLIGRAGGIETKDLIKVLEQYNERESDERWLYELARLYHEAGRIDDCVNLCDEIALWYADGEYEKPALELKFMHKALSASQQARYEELMRDFVDEPPKDEEEEARKEAEALKLEKEAESFVSEFSGLGAFASGVQVKEEKEAPAKEEGAAEAEKAPENIESTPAKENKEPPKTESFVISADKISEVLENFALNKEAVDGPSAGSEPEEAGENEAAAKPEEAPEEAEKQPDETLQAAGEAGNKEPEENKEDGAALNAEENDEGVLIEIEAGEGEALSENITFRLPTDVINSIMEEAEQTNKVKVFSDIILEAARDVNSQPAKRPAAVEKSGSGQENFAFLSDIGLEKLGVDSLPSSPKAYLVKKPSLRKTSHYIEEPTLKEKVDVSNIPIGDEFDGQIGINLNLISADAAGDSPGQITIDEFFEQYAGKVRENSDHVAAVEAQRVRRILDSVKDMEARPLYDMDFNTPEKEDFSEEDIITILTDDDTPSEESEKDAIKATELSEEDLLSEEPLKDEEPEEAKEPEAAEEPEKEPEGGLSEATAEGEDQTESGAGEISAEGAVGEETAEDKEAAAQDASEDEDKKEEAAAEEKSAVEAGLKQGDMKAGGTAEEETVRAEDALKSDIKEEDGGDQSPDGISAPAKDALTSAAPSEAEQADKEPEDGGKEAAAPEAAAEDTLPEKEENSDKSEPGAESEEAGLKEELSETPEDKEGEEASGKDSEAEAQFAEGLLTGIAPEETMRSGLAAALAYFEKTNAKDKIDEADEDALLGFGDNLADIVADTSASLNEVPEKEFEISPEFRKELKEFLLIEGLEDDIRAACKTIANRKRAGIAGGGNLIITGDKKCGKTYLAISVIKAVIKDTGVGTGKVVKVQAQPLNGKNISAVFRKVEGRDLIIENVGYLKDETIRDLIDVMKSGEFTQMIVLEGNMVAIENILAHFPEIKELFASRIDIHELTITQWADIAKRYAKEQGYRIDDMADLALHARIDKINVPSARLGLGDIKDIVDSAIAKAAKRNNGKFFAAFSRKSKEEIPLSESDFSE